MGEIARRTHVEALAVECRRPVVGISAMEKKKDEVVSVRWADGGGECCCCGGVDSRKTKNNTSVAKWVYEILASPFSQ